jgi:phytoene dehydrogenase-like protein
VATPVAWHDDAMDVPAEVDVVVVGAGHNGLICAAYLAEAGVDVAVLEAAPIPGGNTVTEELTLPGFAHDSCSSAHVLIQSNPLLADDELSLLSRWGLRYVHTDPAVVLPRADGDLITVHRDLDLTADEIGRYSKNDATAFRALMDEWNGGLAAAHGRWSSGFDVSDAAAYQELRARSAWDVVHSRFEHPAVRDLMLWLSFATIQDPRRPGTGALPSSITAGRLRFGWSTPIGGSGALRAALIRLFSARGGTLIWDAPVSRIEVRDGRAVAVHTSDGRRFAARKAVVSSAHITKFRDMLAGADGGSAGGSAGTAGGSGLPADLARACETWRPGLSVFAVHAALGRDLEFGTAAAGMGSTDGMARQLDAFYRGETDATDPWLLLVNQTVVDPSRAPAPNGTFKILTVAPWERSDGRPWEETKHAYAEELLDLVRQRTPLDILALRVESPVDVAAHNRHNVGGSCHGGEFEVADGGWMVGWPDYATSIEGLDLTGSTRHPGGSVRGRPGRNAARAVLRGIGLDPAAVMSGR